MGGLSHKPATILRAMGGLHVRSVGRVLKPDASWKRCYATRCHLCSGSPHPVLNAVAGRPKPLLRRSPHDHA